MSFLILFRSTETETPNVWSSAVSDSWNEVWEPHLNWGKKKVDNCQVKKFEMVGYTIDEKGALSWKDEVSISEKPRRQINA
jgi:hypothetical protein